MVQTILERIEQRRRQILVHSFLYYELDSAYIEDSIFDGWCQELVALQKQNPIESSLGAYYPYFKDFEGSTGFNLPYNLPEIERKAKQLLSYRK